MAACRSVIRRTSVEVPTAGFIRDDAALPDWRAGERHLSVRVADQHLRRRGDAVDVLYTGRECDAGARARAEQGATGQRVAAGIVDGEAFLPFGDGERLVLDADMAG